MSYPPFPRIMKALYFQLVRVYTKEHTLKFVKVQEIIAQVDYKVKSLNLFYGKLILNNMQALTSFS